MDNFFISIKHRNSNKLWDAFHGTKRNLRQIIFEFRKQTNFIRNREWFRKSGNS